MLVWEPNILDWFPFVESAPSFITPLVACAHSKCLIYCDKLSFSSTVDLFSENKDGARSVASSETAAQKTVGNKKSGN